ncbi:hypothetical protein COOONC_26971, partial [Cooperia oncophora]
SKSSKKFKRSKTPTTLFKKHFPRRGKSKKGSTKKSPLKKKSQTPKEDSSASKQASEKAFQPPLGEQPQAPAQQPVVAEATAQSDQQRPTDQAATAAVSQGIAVSGVQDGRTVQMEDHRQAIELALDTKPITVPATASFHATASHVPRSTSRSRRRSTSRSTSRVQIPGHNAPIATFFGIIRFAAKGRQVDRESEELIVVATTVLHSYGMTFDERKAELGSLVQVPPAVVNVKTMDDDGFQEEKTTQNVLIGNKMIIVERRSCLLVSISD